MDFPITFKSDEKGYYDRECPNKDCEYTFKVLMRDWEEKISDNEVHCPLCGYISDKEQWYTQEQLNQIERIIADYAYDFAIKAFDKVLKDIERSTRNNKYVKITYKPEKRTSFVNSPIGQREEWETEICCERCGTHYSVIGAAYFCPCCGYNSAVNSFENTLERIKKMLDSLSEIKAVMNDKYGIDIAATMYRDMIEGTIGDSVAAFQKYAACQYEEVSGKEARVNDFQIVDKGSQLFYKAAGKQYSDWLSESEIRFMQDMFQKRHILEHNNGIVDQKYIDSVNNQNYSLGQRIVVKVREAYELLDILEKLGNGLKSISIGEKTDGNN